MEKSPAVSKKVRGDKPSLLERLRGLAGKGDSGVSDLATNPKYPNTLTPISHEQLDLPDRVLQKDQD
jgi:hypothetical protein